MPGRTLPIALLFTLCGCDRLLPFGATLDRSSLTDRSSLVDGAAGTDGRADLKPRRLERGLVDGPSKYGDRLGLLDGAAGPLVKVDLFPGPGDHTVSFAKSDLQIVLVGWRSKAVPTVSVQGFNANDAAGAACGAGIWWAQSATSATVAINSSESVSAVIITIALQAMKAPLPEYWKNSGTAAPSSKLFTVSCRALVDVVAFTDPVHNLAAGAGQVPLGTSPTGGPVTVAASYSLGTQPNTQTTWTHANEPMAWYMAAMCFK